MNENIKIGELNSLKINRVSEPGLYLISEDEMEVLLPNAYITKEMNIGDLLEVFIYTDSEDRLVSTTLTPKAMKDQFAVLEVVDTANFGAFVDIGLPKDLLVPKNRQKSTFVVGQRRLLRVVEDEKSNRLIGDEKIQNYFLNEIKGLERNSQVEIIIYSKTPLGYKVLVDRKYDGMIFHTEIFENINIGDIKIAYVKNIRDDGKLDLSLQKIGDVKNTDIQKVIDVLTLNQDGLKVTSKSDSEEITNLFSMSKKRFKAALNQLIGDKKVTLNDNSIILNK